jgi:hypothetical protein
VAAWLLVVAMGCTGPGTGQYVPSEAVSRRAIETALEAWKNGQAPGLVVGSTPPVSVVDSRRKAKQQLERYEIVKEEKQDERTFYSVKLTLKNPRADETVRFVVVGKDPLWVYREEDFKSGAGM